MLKSGATVVLLGIALIVAIQLVPYGRNHSDPPVRSEPNWHSPQTRELAVRSCFDCHSNQTVWPWYSNVAPLSWLVQRDVDEGRAKLNFSDWGAQQQEEAAESAQSVEEGEMPPSTYLLLHPSAALSGADKRVLIDGFVAMFGRGETQGERERD